MLKTFLSRPRSRPRLISQDQDQDLCFCPWGASRPRPWSRGLHHWCGSIYADVTKHRTSCIVCTGAKYRSWVLVKCVWCSVYYWFRLRKGTGYGFFAFLTCFLLLLLLIQCKISLYLGPVRPVQYFVTPDADESLWEKMLRLGLNSSLFV